MRFLCWLGFHNYELRNQMGVNDYFECSYCTARTYRKRLGFSGYSPVDWDWLLDCNNPRFGKNTGPR